MKEFLLLLPVDFVLLGFGYVIGSLRRPPRKAPDPRPICGCAHHYSYHDPKTRVCHGRVKIGYWNAQDHYEACTCRQYSGPVPIDEYLSQPLAGPDN